MRNHSWNRGTQKESSSHLSRREFDETSPLGLQWLLRRQVMLACAWYRSTNLSGWGCRQEKMKTYGQTLLTVLLLKGNSLRSITRSHIFLTENRACFLKFCLFWAAVSMDLSLWCSESARIVSVVQSTSPTITVGFLCWAQARACSFLVRLSHWFL